MDINSPLYYSLIIISILLGSCVPQKKHIAVQQQVSTLTQNVHLLKGQLALSRDSLTITQSQLVNTLQKQNTQSSVLQEENEQLRNEIAEIKTKWEDYQQKKAARLAKQQQWQNRIAHICAEIDSNEYGINALPNHLSLWISDDWAFKPGTVKLSSQALLLWQNLARTIIEDTSSNATIIVHTDNIGTVASNIETGTQKAAVILTYISEQVPNTHQISAGSQGSLHPIASNQTEQGRESNRRIEIIIRYHD